MKTFKNFLKRNKKQNLYISRPVINIDDIKKWAQEQGITNMVPLGELHTTIAYSKAKVNWGQMGDSFDYVYIRSGKRQIKQFGDASVLVFESHDLERRWKQLCDDGCSWDFPDYNPHITFTYDKNNDISKIKPYNGPIELGPENFSALKED